MGFCPAFRSANTFSSLPATEIWLAFWSCDIFFKKGLEAFSTSGVIYLGWLKCFDVSASSVVKVVRSFLNCSLNPMGATGVVIRLPRTLEDI